MSAVPKHSFPAISDPVARARSWCENLSPFYDVQLDPNATIPSWVSLTSYNLGQILIGNVSAPAEVLRRPAPMFKADGGATNYIRERRLLHALRLLTKPGLRPRISAVTYATGFSDDKTFSRAFRRRFGFAPREAGQSDASPRLGSTHELALLSWIKTLTA